MLEQVNSQELKETLARFRASTTASTSTTTSEPEPESYPQTEFLKAHNLANVDCPICRNYGYIWWRGKDGVTIHSKACDCMDQRRAIRRMNDSGLSEAVSRFNFNNYKTDDDVTRNIKSKAKQFVTHGKCFLICGQSGSGKTHICTAICNELIKQGYSCRYFIWRRDAAELKSMVNSGPDYQKAINKLANIPVLYLDDFLKGSISDADINLAYTIIDERVRNPNGKTIISTELPINVIINRDEALGGRIIEMSKGYLLQAPARNWRTSNGS